MSEFSEYLKKAIENSGCTIYGLSKEINYDRATLNNQINGKRKMTKEVFSKLMNTINLTEKNKKELINLFNKETLGTDYFVLQAVIEAFSKYRNNISYNKSIESLCLEYKTENLKNIISDDETSIIYAINSIVSQELSNNNPTIYFNVDLNKKEILSTMHYAYTSANNKSSIKNIINFSLKENECIDNFNKITNMLPLILNGYCPYYCFNESDLNSQPFILFPYYVLTKEKAILISADIKNATVITDKNIISSYIDEFERKLRICKRFDYLSTSFLNIPFILNESIGSNEKAILYGFNETFGAVPFLSKEHLHYMFSENVPNCDEIIDELQNSYKSVEDFYSYTPIETLYEYINTGIEGCTNNDFSRPLKVEQRIEVLETIKAFVENGGNFFFVKQDCDFIKSMTFNVISDSKMLFFNYENRADKSSMSVISLYSGALKILKQFFEFLHKSYYVLSTEEAIDALNDGIAYAKTLIKNED